MNESKQKLIYALTKHAARNSFIEFLEEEADITEEEYDEIKADWESQGIKPYC